MLGIWSQFENILMTAKETRTGLRRDLSGFGLLAAGGFFGLSDCLEDSIDISLENSTAKNYLPGLPKTVDHQQLKI